MGIKRFKFGKRIITNSVIKEIDYCDLSILDKYFNVSTKNEITLERILDREDKIFGLGENVKGINKRGSRFISYNFDDPDITEDREYLYASHNFLIISNIMNTFGVFIDTPKVVKYDLGFTHLNELKIELDDGFDLYIIESNDAYPEIEIIHKFREMIGMSYIAPFFSFGVGQSRWGYKTKEDLESVIKGFTEKELPLDMLFFDIDCLDEFKDFTFNDSFKENGKININFFNDLKDKGIHLIPIVDAGVKVKEGYTLYDELIKERAYTFDKNGKPFTVGVWPGDSILPDFFSKKGHDIFGEAYKYYLDLGIDGFWNDMNEPALFYGKNNIEAFRDYLKTVDYDNFNNHSFDLIRDRVYAMKNNLNDYKSMYHNYDLVDFGKVNHYDVHNMYGYMMVASASDYFEKYNKDNNLNKKYLLFSRSSMIGSHRYSGIWTGDNAAYWSHLLLNIKMMPSLNMCGYLYSGADIGGFGHNSSPDLLLRWMAFGIFTPLFRNHTCNWVRPKDYHLMDETKEIRNLLQIRYLILPYLYSEYIKAVNNNILLFTPLSFVYKKDSRVDEIEDELLFGSSLLIAPVYKQNAKGRMVYLPEDVLEIRIKNVNDIKLRNLNKGDHYIDVAIDEVVFFLLKGKALPILNINNNVTNIKDLDLNDIKFINNGYKYDKYELFFEENNEVKSKILKVN